MHQSTNNMNQIHKHEYQKKLKSWIDIKPEIYCQEYDSFNSEIRIYNRTDIDHFRSNILTLMVRIKPQNKPITIFLEGK